MIRKHFLRYLIFWLPALAASYLVGTGTTGGQAVQWFLGFFMLFGWGACTGMLAYHKPRAALSLILAYFGAGTLLIMGMASSPFGTNIYRVFDHAAGALTYRPLNMLYQALLDFPVFQEMWVLGIVVAFCVVGLVCGLLYRQVRPNPYRPRFYQIDSV